MPVSLLVQGHGANDPGAVANGLYERDINKAVILAAKPLMEYNGITVPTIFDMPDVYQQAVAVNKLAKEYEIGIAHCVHMNAGGGDGSETIHSIFYGVATEFAKILEEEFDKTGQNRHGTGFVTKKNSSGNADYYGFIRDTDVPSVISEYAFLDSSDYIQASKIFVQAEAIARAHCRFHGIAYKSPSDEGGKTVQYGILLYSDDDYAPAKRLCEMYDFECAILIRKPMPDGTRVPPQIIHSIETLFRVGGGPSGHKKEIPLSGDNWFSTVLEVGKHMKKL